jgi:hypothetical protein
VRTDFCAQAELLQTEHPEGLRHAVLPVDATVTSVQKILQNSALSWSSLMLSKVDEAAYPWALIKGLSEQPLGVSCVAGSSRIDQRQSLLMRRVWWQLALTPLVQHCPLAPVAQTVMPVPSNGCGSAFGVTPCGAPGCPPFCSPRKKPPAAKAPKTLTKAASCVANHLVDEDIVIPLS